MNKNRFLSYGFTLIELLIATVIIGILIAISVPTYLRTAEQAMGTKAMENLKNILTAQMIHMAELEAFTADRALLNTYSPIGPDDADWNYTIASPTTSTFTATATRTIPNNPAYNGLTIIIDENSNITGTGIGANGTYPPP